MYNIYKIKWAVPKERRCKPLIVVYTLYMNKQCKIRKVVQHECFIIVLFSLIYSLLED